MAEGFVVKAVPNGLSVNPSWRSATSSDDWHFFGTREQAMVFPTHSAAVAEAKRWQTIFQPDISVEVEPA
jgi:hypothetical protein